MAIWAAVRAVVVLPLPSALASGSSHMPSSLLSLSLLTFLATQQGHLAGFRAGGGDSHGGGGGDSHGGGGGDSRGGGGDSHGGVIVVVMVVMVMVMVIVGVVVSICLLYQRKGRGCLRGFGADGDIQQRSRGATVRWLASKIRSDL